MHHFHGKKKIHQWIRVLVKAKKNQFWRYITAIPKIFNLIEILKIEIRWNILHTIEHFGKLVVGENLNVNFLETFRVLKFYWILATIWKSQENHCFLSIGWFVDQMALKKKVGKGKYVMQITFSRWNIQNLPQCLH